MLRGSFYSDGFETHRYVLSRLAHPVTVLKSEPPRVKRDIAGFTTLLLFEYALF